MDVKVIDYNIETCKYNKEINIKLYAEYHISLEEVYTSPNSFGLEFLTPNKIVEDIIERVGVKNLLIDNLLGLS